MGEERLGIGIIGAGFVVAFILLAAMLPIFELYKSM